MELHDYCTFMGTRQRACFILSEGINITTVFYSAIVLQRSSINLPFPLSLSLGDQTNFSLSLSYGHGESKENIQSNLKMNSFHKLFSKYSSSFSHSIQYNEAIESITLIVNPVFSSSLAFPLFPISIDCFPDNSRRRGREDNIFFKFNVKGNKNICCLT